MESGMSGGGEAISVLLVEDDSQDAELVRLELERGGFVLDWLRVDTEEELREQLADPRWDLIISDFAMPSFDGLRAFAIYREMQLETPFIFVSGALGEERAVAAMRAGARDYLLKGKLGRLCATIRRELAADANRRSLEQAEQAAQRKQAGLQAALKATNAGLLEYSVPDGTPHEASDRLAEMFGYRPEELLENDGLGDWLVDQIHPLDLPSFQEKQARFLSGELPSLHAVARWRHRSGEWIHVSRYEIAVAKDERGAITQVVAVFLDVTEIKVLEERYLHAQKMEAIGKLAGGIAHDFNNLLTSIISFAGFVRDDLPLGDSRRADIGEVLAAGDRAAALTRQLLLFSRQQPANLKLMDVVKATASIENLLSRTIGEDLSLVIEAPEEPLYILADPGQFDQIVMNLAVNARDAMPDGGSIQILVTSITLDNGEASLRQLQPGPYVQVSVIDSGCGMDEQTITRIFEPFFTTKGPLEGTGLGLATSYGIVQNFGGVIDVESTVGEGTTLRVLLPLKDADADTPRRLKSTQADDNCTETLLVIEDEAALRRIVKRSLNRLGYTVLLAEDAQTGLALFTEHREAIDMVFSDIVLPRGNGFDLAQQIRDQAPHLPILLTSGYSDQRSERPDMEVEILWKPYTPELLAMRIRSCLAAANRQLQE